MVTEEAKLYRNDSIGCKIYDCFVDNTFENLRNTTEQGGWSVVPNRSCITKDVMLRLAYGKHIDGGGEYKRQQSSTSNSSMLGHSCSGIQECIIFQLQKGLS